MHVHQAPPPNTAWIIDETFFKTFCFYINRKNKQFDSSHLIQCSFKGRNYQGQGKILIQIVY